MEPKNRPEDEYREASILPLAVTAVLILELKNSGFAHYLGLIIGHYLYFASFLDLIILSLFFMLSFVVFYTMPAIKSVFKTAAPNISILSAVVCICLLFRFGIPYNNDPLISLQLFSKTECADIIRQADNFAKIQGWSNSRRPDIAAQHIPITEYGHFNNILTSLQYRVVSSAEKLMGDQSSIVFLDAALIRYTGTLPESLKSHNDPGHLTTTVLLTDATFDVQDARTCTSDASGFLNATVYGMQGHAIIAQANTWREQLQLDRTLGVKYILVAYLSIEPPKAGQHPKEAFMVRSKNLWRFLQKVARIVVSNSK